MTKLGLSKLKNKDYFEYRGHNTNGFDFWRYGDDLGKKLDDIEVKSISNQITEKSKCILDLGCGTGYHLNQLYDLRLSEKYVGVDFSESYVQKASLMSLGKDIRFETCEIQEVEKLIKDIRPDVVLMIGLLQYLEKHEIEKLSNLLSKYCYENCTIIAKHPVYYGQKSDTIVSNRDGYEYFSSYKKFEDVAIPFVKNFDFRCMNRLFDRDCFTSDEYDLIDSVNMTQQNMIVFDRKQRSQ